MNTLSKYVLVTLAAATLIVALVTVCAAQPALGQDAPLADPLIATVESMKHSVAQVLCYNRLESPMPTSLGSAFFISSSGTFLTAAHVFSEITEQPDSCRFAAVAVPVDAWDPELREEFHAWFPFRPADCRIDNELDVARCRTIENLSIPRSGMTFAVRPAQIEWNSPPDGSEVASLVFRWALGILLPPGPSCRHPGSYGAKESVLPSCYSIVLPCPGRAARRCFFPTAASWESL